MFEIVLHRCDEIDPTELWIINPFDDDREHWIIQIKILTNQIITKVISFVKRFPQTFRLVHIDEQVIEVI